jgi:hypothetical protein
VIENQRASTNAPLGLPISVVVVELVVVGSWELLVVDVVGVVVDGGAVVVTDAPVVLVVGAAVLVVGAAVLVVGMAVLVVGGAVLVVGAPVVVVVVLPHVNEPSADPAAAHASPGATQSQPPSFFRNLQLVSPLDSV